MPETPEQPPRTTSGLRWFVRISHAVWWLAISFWAVLLLATIALHVLIVPRIIDWRPQIEQMASQAWGVKVSIGELNAVSDGLVPSFELRDFVIRNQQDLEVLRLPQLRASLSPASLLRMSLESIDLDQPQAELRRMADGHWRLAGMDLSGNDSADMADWLLRQPAFNIHQGRLRWVDETLSQSPLEFTEVDLQLRSGLRSHQWRLDANPPVAMGQRISLQGQFTQSLFDSHASDLSTWSGKVFGQTAQIDLGQLAAHVPHDQQLQLLSAQGWLRAWAEVDHGQLRNPTLDFSLSQFKLQLGDKLPDLLAQQLSGRVHWQAWKEGLGQELRTQDLHITLDDGETWTSGDTRLAWRSEGEEWAKAGELQVDSVSLGMLGRVAERLPLDAELRAQLKQAKPSGQLSKLDLRWFDAHTPALQFSAKGAVTDLNMQSSAPHSPPTALWWPGAQGAQVQFQMNEHGGKAQVSIQNGAMSLVDWLEEPRIPLHKLKGEVSWEKQNTQWQLHIAQAQLSNEFAQAEFDLTWKEGTSSKSAGHLDLQAKVQRLEARALHRYLPVDMEAPGRRYVRDALTGGQFTQAKLVIQGPLDNFPFVKNEGVFTINAPFQQATFQYAPSSPQPLMTGRKDVQNWPALQQLSGELHINRNRLLIKSGAARMGVNANLQVPKLEVQINDLADIVVEVNAQLKGNLSDALNMVNNSPLAEQVKPFLGTVSANGTAEHQLRLTLPVDKLELSRVQGSVILPGNDVLWQPGLPRFYKLRGTVNYTESGMNANGVRMRFMGGEAKLDGGLRFHDSHTEGPARLVLQGAVNAEALQQAQELGSLNSLAAVLSGSTNYVASLGLRQGLPEYVITSNMQGMGVDLPAPMDKHKEAIWPLRIDNELIKNSGKSAAQLEQIRLNLGSVLGVSYVRDIDPAVPTVLRGQIVLGTPSPVKDAPDNAVVLQIRHPKFNADEWQQALSPWTEGDSPKPGPVRSPWQAYSPSRIDLVAPEFIWLGRSFHQLQASADRPAAKNWRIQAKATELQGSAEYRPAQDNSSARLVARLTHLTIPPTMLEEVETALSDSPKDLPALDIVVDNLELRGVQWGRAEIDGYARTGPTGAREWVLNKMNLTMPEASFQSKGQWGGPGKAAAKRSQLDFTLQIQDSGELLDRLGFKGALRQGKGRMAGQVGWQGSPFSPDYNSMSGQFNINLERGQFLKADPGVSRLLGVLSLQSLPRRLMLDFSDVFSEGFAFDFVRGDVVIAQGMASTNNLQMKGVSAAVLMEGRADIQRETQDIKVVVVPELNAGTASLVYSTINPVVGITSFLAQYFLRRPLIKSNTQEFRVQGSWKDPKVVKVETPPAANAPTPAKP